MLEDANWDRLWAQCLLYAVYQEKRYPGLQNRSRDIVQSAIEKTFSGERVWDPQACDLLHHLKMTIRSLCNNAYGRHQSQLKHARLSRSELTETASAAKAQEDLDYLRKAVRFLRQHDPALAEFFVTACHHLTTNCETDREAAAAMNIAPSTFTKNKARISRIIASQDDTSGREQTK